MFQILHPEDQHKGRIAAVEFEGEPYRAGVSLPMQSSVVG